MHDLRHDQEAADERTHYDLQAVPRNGIDPASLRTVPMPDLRSPAARDFDAKVRDLRTYDERSDARLARIEEAIERIADAVTVLMLERETRGEAAQKGRRINGYE